MSLCTQTSRMEPFSKDQGRTMHRRSHVRSPWDPGLLLDRNPRWAHRTHRMHRTLSLLYPPREGPPMAPQGSTSSALRAQGVPWWPSLLSALWPHRPCPCIGRGRQSLQRQLSARRPRLCRQRASKSLHRPSTAPKSLLLPSSTQLPCHWTQERQLSPPRPLRHSIRHLAAAKVPGKPPGPVQGG